MFVYLNGLVLGISLIMALGPQNIFLIRQSAMRQHPILSTGICFLSDFALITCSVIGLHQILERHSSLRIWMVILGSLFLLYYGAMNIKSALLSTEAKQSSKTNTVSRKKIITLALGFSLLNPQAIIDSLVLIGGGSIQYPEHHQAFLFGVITSSFIWFTGLSLTAYYLSTVLMTSTVWRRIEFLSGILMVYLGIKLVIQQLM